MIRIKVIGEPKALKRHRHVNRGKFIGTYDPSSGDKADFLSMVQQNAPAVAFDQPLEVKMLFVFPRPKSHYRTGKNADMLKENASHYHTSKPDGDNLAKFVFDALNKIYWKDDSCVALFTIKKIYCNEKYQQPCTIVLINTLENE